MTIVGSVLLGMLLLIFVLYPLGLLSAWWLAILISPFIIEEIQELTRYYLASSYCQKLEEALITEIRLTTEYTDTLRVKNKQAPQSHRVMNLLIHR